MDHPTMTQPQHPDKPVNRIRLTLPISANQAAALRAGDLLLLTGWLYTARDAAHKKMIAALAAGQTLPVDWNGETIYYAGPCPGRPGQPVGAAGPTTSGRMDAYAPTLLQAGLRVMIGKGARSAAVIEAMQANGAVYLGATGGAGALLAQCIREAEIIAYPELGTEAIRRLKVVDFPAVVLIDNQGNNLYEIGKAEFQLDNNA
jgi:fumarate hydratase subunit beta